MRGIKLALLCAVVCVGFQAQAAKLLNYGHRAIEMNDRLDMCGGGATLTFLPNEAILRINSLRCRMVSRNAGPYAPIQGEYVLGLNTVNTFVLGNPARNVIEVNTTVPQVPAPPAPVYERIDLYGNGAEKGMTACGGVVKFHHTFWTDTPQIEFHHVSACQFYTVLAVDGSRIIYPEHRVLTGNPGNLGNKFALPAPAGFNIVKLRLQGQDGHNMEDIIVHFAAH